MIEIDCYYSLSSPWAYFAGPRLQDIVRRHHARLTLKPYDFQAVVVHNGGVPIRTRPEPRRTYHDEELVRWGEYLGMAINPQPAHYPRYKVEDPDWNKYAGWMVIAGQLQGQDMQALSHALLRALWAEEQDTARPEIRIAIADANGYDGRALHALERSPQVQAAYAQYSREAQERGIFGAPTFWVDGVRYWGQDRLDFVDRALERLRRR
jgi:2-hydroxychromene-2-carboxylate isomerase